MSAQIKKPLALVGENSNKFIEQGLIHHGFEVMILPFDPRLAPPVSSHADMLIFCIDGRVFCNEEYYKKNTDIFSRIEQHGYVIEHSDFHVSAEYPNDVSLNQAVIGKSILGRADSCAESILKYAYTHGYTYISIKQGYAKCSTLILNDDAVISADRGIISIAQSLNINALQIENNVGSIDICGYDYGFIGGASAVYGDKVFFFGNHLLHRQGAKIDKFCKDCGYTPVPLSQDTLCDIGGAIILPFLNEK